MLGVRHLRTFPAYLALCCHALSLYAGDADPFTLRKASLHNALPTLNAITNSVLQDAVGELNHDPHASCNPQALRSKVRRAFGGWGWGKFERDLEHNHYPDIEILHLKRTDSIYQDFGPLESMTMYFVPLSGMIRIKEYYISLDKIGHFFEEGYFFYHHLFEEKKDLPFIATLNQESELGIFGLFMMGIYSYADTVANANGTLFYRALSQNTDLTNTSDIDNRVTYFRCEQKHWVLSKPFVWEDYIDASWDEGINCNMYRSEKMHNAVQKNIQSLGFASCPVQNISLPEYRRIAGRIGAYTLNPQMLPQNAQQQYGVFSQIHRPEMDWRYFRFVLNQLIDSLLL